MTAQELIDVVHRIDALEADEGKARQESALRRGTIAALRAKIEGLTTREAAAKITVAAIGSAVDAALATVHTKKRESPRQDAIRSLIQRKPDANYADLAIELYGEYTHANVLNARSLVSKMKAAGLLAGEPRAWRSLGDIGGQGAPAVPMSPLEREAPEDGEENAA